MARDFGQAVHVFAEAIGRPGQRRFRLQVVGESGDSASFWMEKEQLSALGDAIETVLGDEGYQYQRLPLDDTESPAVFPYAPDIDTRVAELSLGVNRERSRLVVIVTGADADAGSARLEVEYRRAHELRRQIADVVSSGRPTCPLCTGPIDPAGHMCVKRNGHHKPV